ncbi:AraC-like DNA-binding protein [Pseudomonas oryzihabitans]
MGLRGMRSSVSTVNIQDEEGLQQYYDKCGLAPEIVLPKTKPIDYQKTTYLVNDLFLCSTRSASGWGFRKQQETNVYFLSFTTEGMSEWKMRDADMVQCARRLCVVDSSRLITGQFLAGTTTETIMLSSDLLHAEMGSLQGYSCQQRLDFGPMVVTGSDAWYAIAGVAHALRLNVGGSLLGSPIALSHLRQALISTILERIPHNFTETLYSARLEVLPSVLRKALDFMVDRASSPIGLADIAIASGTSGRNLQLLFKAYRGLSPMAVLRDIRLQRCREAILGAKEPYSISEIALRWGFTNSYVFTRYYGKRFGETPSETALRSRR